MNYLELCRTSLLLSGTGSGITLESLDKTTVYERQVIEFVRQAWRDIQQMRESWGWRANWPFAMQTVVGKPRYTWDEFRDNDGEPIIPSFRSWNTNVRWFITDPERSLSAGIIPEISYEEYRRRSRAVTTPNRPTSYAVGGIPSEGAKHSLYLHPTPDRVATIEGACQVGVQQFKKEEEDPFGLSPDYHDIIVWKAIMSIHGFDEDGESYVWAKTNYDTLLTGMEQFYLPKPKVAGALA